MERGTGIVSEGIGVAGYAKSAYLESEVVEADPIRLVRMLYQVALDAVSKAKRHLRNGEIRDRSRQVTRAIEALAELSGALDAEKGGEIAVSLGRLYEYMSRRLQEANALQVEPPLVEVERLLTTLWEAWREVEERGAISDHESSLVSHSQAWTPGDTTTAYCSRSVAG
jgi:flagellar protein FliS